METKDKIDIAIKICNFLLIGIIGTLITVFYKEQNNYLDRLNSKMSEIQTARTFIDHITSKNEDEIRLSYEILQKSKVFKDYEDSKSFQVIVDYAMANIRPIEQKAAPVAKTGELVPKSGELDGWAYLGHYVRDTGKWKTRYFEFPESELPADIKATKDLKVRTITGKLNVRLNMPNPMGEFFEIIDILEPGTEVEVDDVQQWQESGFYWAKIKYSK